MNIWFQTDLAAFSYNWFSMGGDLTGAPSLNMTPGYSALLAAQGTDNHAWTCYACWGSWSYAGGTLIRGDGVGMTSRGRPDLFVRGTDGALWKAAWLGVYFGPQWGSWQRLGFSISSAPAAVNWWPVNSNPSDVFFVDGNGHVLHVLA